MKSVALGFLVVLVTCSAGCGRPDSRETSKATSVWSCVIGTTGGFTGGGDGYEIHSDGRVLAWSLSTADAEIDKQPIGQAEPEQLLPLMHALAVPDLRSIELRETGNMTTFLEARSSEQPTQRWSWPADRMGGRTPKVPAPVHTAFEAALAIAQQHGGGR
jgi:hypothetical protein